KLRDAGDDKSGSFSGWLFPIRKWRVCGMRALRWIAAGPKSNIVFSTTALRVCRCDTTLGLGVLQLALLPQEHYWYMTREQCEMTGLSRLLCRQSQTPSKTDEAVRKPPSAA